MLAAQMATDMNRSNVSSPKKLERRDSTTSESSLEHLDLGRTPKKLNTLSSATSTPHIAINGGYNSSGSTIGEVTTTSTTANIVEPTHESGQQKRRYTARRNRETDESNDYDDEESADEKKNQPQRLQRHHKKRGAPRLDKRTSVQLEYNADNPNSLRKKFRFSRNGGSDSALSSNNNNNNNNNSDLTHSTTNNESGFVDATNCSSQYLNSSNASSQKPQCSISGADSSSGGGGAAAASVMPHSSASSSPHGGDAGASSASSPESGIGEREDMKYVCPICEVVSATPHEFTNHIRCHNYNSGENLNFTCRICSKALSSASSLDRHVLVHTGERPFNCKYCHLTFTTNGNMHRHMRTHKEHQHTHHRRNSNGTKNNANAAANNNNSNSNNNNNNNNNSVTPAVTVPGTGLNSTSIANTIANNNSTTAHAQLTNGNVIAEGVNQATATTTTTTTTTSTSKSSASKSEAGANGRRFNTLTGSVESCESDGDGDGVCSTDSSSAISQCSNNHSNNNNNNNTNYNDDCSNNNNTKSNSKNNSFKRKSNNHHLDAAAAAAAAGAGDITADDDEIALMKRRVKTTINNNNIIVATTKTLNSNSVSMSTPILPMSPNEHPQQPISTLACPVCDLTDFENMLTLSAHIDSVHPDIPAKCRNCDVVFRTHRQLNVHPCTQRDALNLNTPLPAYDCSKERYPLIAKSLSTNIKLDHEPTDEHLKLSKYSPSLPHAKALSTSECSAGEADTAEEQDDEAADTDNEQQRRDAFFRHLYLQNKSLNSLVSPPLNRSMDEQLQGDQLESIKSESESEKNTQNLLSQDSKDLADIQSILNMTSSSSTSNFLRNLEQSVHTPSSNCSVDKEEEEAQDAYRSEIRKMKLRGEFPCKLCKEKFRNLRALKGHIKEHSSPAGPFRCTVCSFTIIDKAAFRQHMLTHKGDRPYECVVCNFAFTTKANCERHLRNIHAMTTRDDVKRAIIYHPSEDSSCDDPSKKLHLFSSPEFDDDGELPYQHQHPKDRSTPVSHLKEMLTNTSESPSSKPLKIQVKSLEQLLDKSSTAIEPFVSSYEDKPATNGRVQPETAPIDLSMDVLDLSKKPTNSKPIEDNSPCVPPEPSAPVLPQMDQFVQFAEKMKEQLLQMWKEPFSNFWLPLATPLNPFPPQNPALSNNLEEMQKLFPLLKRMFEEANLQPNLMSPSMEPAKAVVNNLPLSNVPQRTMVPQISPLLSDKHESINSSSPIAPINHLYPKSLTATGPGNSPLSLHSRHSQMPPTMLPGGPVKMVIKNGVLMPKQKQRRYRTERPFACEHCSARFTLRSNMERHVKQQHPQFYAQRQRSGHHIMRGRGASSASAMNSFSHLQAAFAQAHNNSMHANVMGSASATISDQVKNAILAQHLKARKESDLLQQALAHGSSSIASNQLLLDIERNGMSPLPVSQQFGLNNMVNASHTNGCVEDDEPKLVIDEDEDEDMDDDDIEEVPMENEDDVQEVEQKVTEDPSQEPTPAPAPPKQEEESKPAKTNVMRDPSKKVREALLEQAITALHKNSAKQAKTEIQPPTPATTMKSMIAQAESVGKFLKEVASSPFKDESQDLVPVSKLVDNATNNSVTFNNYFRPSDVTNHMEQSDEEGLVASGSASESNNSGTEDVVTNAEPKKKSAYSLAPNRVSCPYCQRMFPWSSSLRRHILTHTGQKPFKCSHCPLLFTTKSNCDRHLLRKHGNVESAMSVYMPTEDVTEPIPVPKSVEEIEQQQRQREEEEKRRKAEEDKQARELQERQEREQRQQQKQQHQQNQQKQEQEQQQQQQQFLKQLVAAAQLNQSNIPPNVSSNAKIEQNSISSSDLPYKCHLCENSFGERFQCLDHINNQHKQDFLLLLAKGAIEIGAEPGQIHSNDDEESRAPLPGEENGMGGRSGGRYPDYSNRKVICAFCVRRFWSTEDLRRHMRTHSGERPFQCDVCLRKFTLKHSMLRHMKKHNGHPLNGTSSSDLSAAGNSGSDFSDDEQSPSTTTTTTPTSATEGQTGTNSSSNSMSSLGLRAPKIQELLNKANEWRTSRLGEHKENISEEHNQQTDLIGNLLGISDQGILNKLLTSADEAAKLLGVDK